MMGVAQWDPEVPVAKGTNAILALSREFEAVGKYGQPPVCIHCGKCVEVCPVYLLPNYIAEFDIAGRLEVAERFGAEACVECGACSYICPGYFPVTQHVKNAKASDCRQKKAGMKYSGKKTQPRRDKPLFMKKRARSCGAAAFTR